ncbi:hypothetical protein BDQ17DRAFT_1369493 [Cyathus striatus]|nr:hypothetical protein BDQ17DRAFT_1369493 [Cyathus striatus]
MVSRILGVTPPPCGTPSLHGVPPVPRDTLWLHASSIILYRMMESCSVECYDHTS